MSSTQQVVARIADNVEKVIIGKRAAIELTLTSLICDGHVLIEDVPGVGKTGMVSAIAKSIRAEFRRIQFTPDVLPSDITGFSVYNQKTGAFEFRPGAVMCNLLLADEINRTSPKTQAALLEAMEERQVSVDGVTRPIPRPFLVLATENPVEYLGTNPLPEAQVDRFFLRVSLGYPTAAEESSILTRYRQQNPLDTLEPVATVDDILRAQQEVRAVYVSPEVNRYIVALTRATRGNSLIRLGVSPRGTMFLCRAAQAVALMSGRDYVIPDDVRKMTLPVLCHRLTVTPEGKQQGVTPENFLGSVLRNVRAPVAARI